MSSVFRVAAPWGTVVLYVLTIWWLSSGQQPIALDAFPLQDKGVHFLEYGGLAFCIARAVFLTFRAPAIRAALTALLLSFGLSLLDELHQLFVPTRTADALDLLADLLGAAVAIALYTLLVGRKHTARTPAP